MVKELEKALDSWFMNLSFYDKAKFFFKDITIDDLDEFDNEQEVIDKFSPYLLCKLIYILDYLNRCDVDKINEIDTIVCVWIAQLSISHLNELHEIHSDFEKLHIRRQLNLLIDYSRPDFEKDYYQRLNILFRNFIA